MSGPIPPTPLESWIAVKIGEEGRPLSLHSLRAYQLTKLNETLSRAQQRSAFYRRLLGEREIRLSTLEDVADLPFTTAADISAAPLDFVCAKQDQVERIVTLPTSGTTGPPKRIFYTAEDQDLTRDFFHHGMSTLVGPRDRVLILLPGSLPGSVGELLKDGLERLGAEALPHGPVTDPRRTLDLIHRERVNAMVGVPVQVLTLARLGRAEGLPRPAGLRSVLLSTDRVPYAVARAIEDIWGCDVYNHYGTTEMGLGGGVDCRARSGYHIREADLLFEVVDPVTGRPAAEGEQGEVVFTTLTRQAMPLIRYRTGDVSRFLPEPCRCGTVLKRMAHVDGRLTDGISLPGGATLSQRDFDEALFPLDELADFKIVYREGPGRPTLIVQVLPCSDRSRVDKKAVLESLRSIPAFSGRRAQGTPAVKVMEWKAGDDDRPSTAKRHIAHFREAVG